VRPDVRGSVREGRPGGRSHPGEGAARLGGGAEGRPPGARSGIGRGSADGLKAMKRMVKRTTLPMASLAALLFVAGAHGQTNPDAEARFAMGVSHLREGRVDMALEDFQKAAKLDPKNAYVMKGLGQAYA